MLCDFGPVVIVDFEALQEEQSLLVAPSAGVCARLRAVDAHKVLGVATGREAAVGVRLRAQIYVRNLGAVVPAGRAVHPWHRVAEIPRLDIIQDT